MFHVPVDESNVVVGMAQLKIQSIAEELYASTPQLAKELPMTQSRILSESLFSKQVQANEAKKKESVKVAMIAEDWEHQYYDKWRQYEEKKKEAEALRDNLIKRQERYIKREQEYRKTIEEIQNEIKDRSTNPLRIPGKSAEEEPKQPEYMKQKKNPDLVSIYEKIM